MFERLFGGQTKDPAVMDRVPPGQYVTEKFPVLHYGSIPHVDLSTWDFKVYGEVDLPFSPDLEGVQGASPQDGPHGHPLRDALDEARHRLGGRPIQEILELAQVRPTATHVVAHAEQGYTANLPLSVLDDDDVILADTFGGEPLEPEHGYPLRLLVPKRYFWKSAKWIRGLEFLPRPARVLGALRLQQRRGPAGRKSASASSRHRTGQRAIDQPVAGMSVRLASPPFLWAGVVAPVLFTSSYLVDGATRAGYDPLRHQVSLLSLGDRGWVRP